MERYTLARRFHLVILVLALSTRALAVPPDRPEDRNQDRPNQAEGDRLLQRPVAGETQTIEYWMTEPLDDSPWANALRRGVVARSEGRLFEAEQALLESIREAQQSRADRKRRLVASNIELAKLYELTGKMQKAEDRLREAVTLHEQQVGSENPELANSLEVLAAFYESEGKDAQAEPIYSRAIALRDDGSDSVALATDLTGLARIEFRGLEYDMALSHALRAWSIFARMPDAPHALAVESLHQLARIQDAGNDIDAARSSFLRAAGLLRHDHALEKQRSRAFFDSYFDFLARRGPKSLADSLKQELSAAQDDLRRRVLRK